MREATEARVQGFCVALLSLIGFSLVAFALQPILAILNVLWLILLVGFAALSRAARFRA